MEFEVFLFFKQKTAYEVLRSLVGSEMCIRDSAGRAPAGPSLVGGILDPRVPEIRRDPADPVAAVGKHDLVGPLGVKLHRRLVVEPENDLRALSLIHI